MDLCCDVPSSLMVHTTLLDDVIVSLCAWLDQMADYAALALDATDLKQLFSLSIIFLSSSLSIILLSSSNRSILLSLDLLRNRSLGFICVFIARRGCFLRTLLACFRSLLGALGFGGGIGSFGLDRSCGGIVEGG